MKVSVNSIYKLLIITLFLDAYRFFGIGMRNITPFYIGAILLFAISFVRLGDIVKGVIRNPYSILVPLFMIFDYILLRCDALESLLIGLFCWLFYVCSYRRVLYSQFQSCLAIYQNLMNAMAVYAIYQIFAYYFNLPFSDPSISGHMVDGYNWGNSIVVGGLQLRRSNAVFREPSFLSQFLAINILIYIQKYIDDVANGRTRHKPTFVWIGINLIALICSFSGTGLFMLIGGTVILLYKNRAQNLFRFIGKRFVFVLFCIVAVSALILIPNPLTAYMFSRLGEFNAENLSSISGYVRLILPYRAVLDIIRYNNPLFGIGIGNSLNFVTRSGLELEAHMAPIFPRAFAETGLIGGILVVLFMFKTWNKNNVRIGSYRAMLIGVYLLSFMHGTWSSEVYWLLLGFLNVQIVDADAVLTRGDDL